ncbi:coiled-coil domain-containing protein isoform X7 [Aphis craccivora]|uniref:Coiled-coil domain-containing protein isoform X7 n=1 Tax=Aphis craccivora TaxID=307492 RepID=A0A6G0ZPD1_APHCR|nr:coiled-coil domain-containing protein isoform X7 [Aphis craccivora]
MMTSNQLIVIIIDQNFSGYMSSPERASSRTGYTAAPYMSPGGSSFDDNSYYGYGPRTGSITPVIDEETR